MSISVCYSVAKSCPTHCYPIAAARQASLFFTISWSWLKLMPIELVMLSNHLIVCRALLLLSSNFPSTKVFSNELTVCIRWLKYWSFSISPSNECSGLISFRIRLVYCLLAVERALKSLLRYHNLKASVLPHLAFFMAQLSHLYMTTGKAIALNIQTFVRKMMSLLFNTLILS